MEMQAKQFAIYPAVTATEISNTRKKLGVTQKEFARLIGTSIKTVERWECSDKPITGPIVCLLRILNEYPAIIEKFVIPEKRLPVRLLYMHNNDICTIIDVDERKREVAIHNVTSRTMYRAFGMNEHPKFEEYLEFLQSRCFPVERDKLKLVLRDLDIPFYEPFMIIEKTEGRMAEDDFWIKIER